ncbi:MAG TPA: hypothetical protein PKW08_02285 [Flavobacteriaceae bacterium]|nr:hypothetical protein [Flavobacteriaceae bacterium]MCB9212291.1 hypothetical protein [Alteromonas sp.]HPF10330.1 hypothetical protein [Flavobacteriaceae bacterium]HQU20394.1 hypothetical protein [Flavobacteriaceae bacterium]HQU65732.1 hypothetical protein [Flavobacteriaceae bacterium]
MKHKKLIGFLFFAMIATAANAQCAMCRAVLESEDGEGTAAAINNGIVYLMIFPYLLIGGLLYIIYRMKQKGKI